MPSSPTDLEGKEHTRSEQQNLVHGRDYWKGGTFAQKLTLFAFLLLQNDYFMLYYCSNDSKWSHS